VSRLSAPGDKDLAAQWRMNVVYYTQPIAPASLLAGHSPRLAQRWKRAC
jgi:hypothetical protein